MDLCIVMLEARVCLVATAVKFGSMDISNAKTLPEGSWLVTRTSGKPSLFKSVTWQSNPAPKSESMTVVEGASVAGSKW